MNKLFFTMILALGITSFANAQCGEDASYIEADCISGCFSIMDTSTYFPTTRKPTLYERIRIASDLNRRCSTIEGRATITEPGFI